MLRKGDFKLRMTLAAALNTIHTTRVAAADKNSCENAICDSCIEAEDSKGQVNNKSWMLRTKLY